MVFECFRGQLFENGKRYTKSETSTQKALEERIPNHILHVQFERKISVSQSNLLYVYNDLNRQKMPKRVKIIHVNLLPQKFWRNFLENWLKNWRILSVFDMSKMWVNNAKITYHVQRDVHLNFLSPLIKKSNSSICIVYFLYPETKHKSYLLWETNLRLAKPRTLSSSCNLSLPLNYHYEVYFTEHCQKTFTQILAFFNLF